MSATWGGLSAHPDCTSKLLYTAIPSHLGKSPTSDLELSQKQEESWFPLHEKIRLRMTFALYIARVDGSAWGHLDEMDAGIWYSHNNRSQPIHTRRLRPPYWLRTRQERPVEKNPEGLLHDRLSCVYIFIHSYVSVKVQRFQRETR